MSQYLPYGGFKWLNWRKIDRLDANSISKNSLTGYILEADHECCDELHELHNDYPLAPGKLKINDMLSSYWSNIANKYCIKIDVLINQFKIYVIKVNMPFITEIFSWIYH